MIRYFALCLGLLTLTACGSDADSSATAPASAPPVQRDVDPIPKFDRDSAYAFVAKQVAFGPRVMNTPAHEATAGWLIGKLEGFGANVETQKFTASAYDGTPLESTNIIGRYYPDRPDRIALYAHWDTRPVADSPLSDNANAVVNGADDGASGVGVLLEIARQLQTSDPGLGVDIIFLDAEDYGEPNNANSYGLGAQHYARNLPVNKPRFGILLDMVGGKNARFAREGYSMRYARPVVDKIWKLGRQMGYGSYFIDEAGGGVTDDHYFINEIARIPTIDIIHYPTETETRFPAHWHTGNDNMDVIDKRTLRAVGQVVLASLFREGARTL